MRRSKWMAAITLAVGMAATATTLPAADRRDLNRDYRQVNSMRSDMAADQTRLNEDIRCGRTAAASRDAADLARDQRALAAQTSDIRHDRRDWR